MTTEDLEKLFDKLVDMDLDRFPPTMPDDLRAMTILNNLLPGSRDMVACAEHDQIWLDTDLEGLARVASISDIEDLVRCGVWLDHEAESLSMFV